MDLLTLRTSHELSALPTHWTHELWEAYSSSFPYDERRDPAQLMDRLGRSPHPLYIIIGIEAERLVAFAMLYDLNELHYIEYLCVPATHRNKGVGAHFLGLLQRVVGLPLVLEAEPTGANEWADRRLDFYSRCGFTALDHPYLQPAYHVDSAPVPLTLMVWREPAIPASTIEHRLHRDVYGAK